MNDAITGYTPYSLWSGLNEATRSKETVNGAEVSDYGFGGYNGLTNIDPMASKVRTGWRGSVLTNSALYRLRLMLTYSSGELDNGWAYAFSASARLGGNDWIKGVYYRSFGYYGSVEKNSATNTNSDLPSWPLRDREVRRTVLLRKFTTSWVTICTTPTGVITTARSAMPA